MTAWNAVGTTDSKSSLVGKGLVQRLYLDAKRRHLPVQRGPARHCFALSEDGRDLAEYICTSLEQQGLLLTDVPLVPGPKPKPESKPKPHVRKQGFTCPPCEQCLTNKDVERTAYRSSASGTRVTCVGFTSNTKSIND